MTSWSSYRFEQQRLRRLAEEQRIRPYRTRASKILERIGFEEHEDRYGWVYYDNVLSVLAHALADQLPDPLRNREGGLDELRSRLEFRRWCDQQRLWTDDDGIPF